MHLEPLRQPVAQDCFERAVTDTDNPRAVDPPPSAAVARRIAARHANRLTQRREHRPDPTAAAGPPTATRPRTARPSPPPDPEAVNRHRCRPRESSGPTHCTGYYAAPNGSRCRSAASPSAVVVVAARDPPPSSTSIANSPPPRPSTRERRSSIRSGTIPLLARSHLPFGPPERSQPATLRPGIVSLKSHLQVDDSLGPQRRGPPASNTTSSASCTPSSSAASSPHSASSFSSRRAGYEPR